MSEMSYAMYREIIERLESALSTATKALVAAKFTPRAENEGIVVVGRTMELHNAAITAALAEVERLTK